MQAPREPDLLPMACTLGPADGAARVERWRALSTAYRLGVERRAGQLRLRFRADEDVTRELTDLVEAERDCCAFVGWELERTDGEVVVVISGAEDALATLPFAG